MAAFGQEEAFTREMGHLILRRCIFHNHVYHNAHRFVRNVNAAFGQQILNIAVIEWKPEIQPDGMLDDLRREPMPGVGDFAHSSTLPRR